MIRNFGHRLDKTVMFVEVHHLSLPSVLPSHQAVSVEGNKVVSTVTLKATPDIMKSGVICEATNDYGTDSRSFPVSLKRGQCEEKAAVQLF